MFCEAAPRPQPSGANGCWDGGFGPEVCCGRELGSAGNPQCFDSIYTPERCCGGSAEERTRRGLEATSWRRELARLRRRQGTVKRPAEGFDYVVVGAGSGGSTAAATLAAHPSKPSVLLLDVGDWDVAAEYFASSIVNASFNRWPRPVWWLVRSQPPFRRDLGGGYALKVGLALGGGSAVNRGLHTWGGTGELRRGLRLTDEELVMSFQRLHKRLRASARVRRRVAPVFHRRVREELQPVLQSIVEAFAQVGVPFRENAGGVVPRTLHGVHGGTWLSLACPRSAMRAGSSDEVADLARCARQSAYSGLVAPFNGSRPNLVVRPASLVTKLHWGEKTAPTAGGTVHGRAVGVEVLEVHGTASHPPLGQALSFDSLGTDWERQLGDQRYVVGVRRSVILAAGAVGSPAVLLRSGVGPPGTAQHLRAVPYLNLTGVGEGLRDRVAVCTTVIAGAACGVTATRTNDVPSVFVYFNFSEEGRHGGEGPLEVELNVVEGCIGGQQALSLRFILQRTEEAGRLHVVSPHPFVAPHAELRASDRDLHRIMELLRWFHRRILSHGAVVPHVAGIFPELAVLNSDEQLEAFVRQVAEWYLHPSGSLASGGAAVDADLSLHGVANVRVADASVLPNGLPTGHPDVSIRMLGEVVAQRLLAEADGRE